MKSRQWLKDLNEAEDRLRAKIKLFYDELVSIQGILYYNYTYSVVDDDEEVLEERKMELEEVLDKLQLDLLLVEAAQLDLESRLFKEHKDFYA